ncbi:MAG TPA: acyl-ACP--UDP-N-acetylglucosamine O-acyltransferase [Candidatus Saccharimonadales bacterium]|nr:acyl-ACP--UDP-N-acetylglucosamine O-acyltransferase [Candidatus Saccharimonadales bacterium]
MSGRIHPSASVSDRAVIGPGTEVGAFAVIGDEVTLGADCTVMSHAVLQGPTKAGDGCRFHPFSSVGSDPQDLKYQGERTELVIGSRNVFREFVTVNRGTAGGGGVTRIGDDNLFMAYAHVAHDCHVGSGTIFANAATLAGHVEVEDGATVGAFSAVHQQCRIGRQAFIGGFSVVTRDALPFVKTVGEREISTFGINAVGLKRRGFSAEAVESLQKAYRILKQSGLNTSQALERIEAEGDASGEVAYLIAFIRGSSRGVIK